jgi:alpha-L-fucosidase
VVLFGKAPDELQRKCMVWDIERGVSNRIEPQPFQSETCLGSWHYDRAVYEKDKYKSAATVIHMLADIVSKNGNLLLSVPMRGDGTIDEKERAIVEAIADWMAVNREAIFGTRPWKVFGEGPACEVVVPIEGQGFNEGKGKPFSAKDVRFTTKGNVIYAITLGLPSETINFTSMGTDAGLLEAPIRSVRLLGSDEKLNWSQKSDALLIEPPTRYPSKDAAVFIIVPGD